MHFELITVEEFTKFASKSPYRSFLQTAEIARLREKQGWTAYFFGVRGDDDKILAATMAVAKPTFLGKSLFYSPGGPLVDYENTELVDFFFKHLRAYARSHNGYVFQMAPYYELRERDINGALATGGFDHTAVLTNLRKNGLIEVTEAAEPKYLFALDLHGEKPDDLIMTFKQNTRNLIRRAAKLGVTVRELSREELPLFKEITERTSERRHFHDRALEYYENMYDLFAPKGEVKFLLAEAPETGPLAVAMFMLYGDEVVYLFSGSEQQYMHKYNAQYAIQWYMIRYALAHGYKRYNFYGIQGLPDPASPDYGIYHFKKGFGGRVIELVGTYEMPVNRGFYGAWKMLRKLRG